MSLADKVLADYRRALNRVGETIVVRRYTGAGPSRTHADTEAKGRVSGYQPDEIIGSIQQGDRRVILYPETLTSLLPLTANDKLVVRGKELAIQAVDDSTRRINGTLIALEVQVRG